MNRERSGCAEGRLSKLTAPPHTSRLGGREDIRQMRGALFLVSFACSSGILMGFMILLPGATRGKARHGILFCSIALQSLSAKFL